MPTRVLIADDSPTVRRVVSRILDRHGLEPIAFSGGPEMLAWLESHGIRAPHGPPDDPTVDVILVDHEMPTMNGSELAAAIRRLPGGSAAPIVLMSAKTERIRDEFFAETGALDAITKPFDSRALVAVIENATRRAIAPQDDTERNLLSSPPSELAPDTQVDDVVLRGNLGQIAIGAILQLLQMESLTGVLEITSGRSTIVVIMRDGLIDLVQAESASHEFRLGRFFVSEGLATPSEIERLVSNRSPNDRRVLGELLVEEGKITQEQLNQALERQSSELVYEAVRWKSGSFAFRRMAAPTLAERTRLGLPVAFVVMEGFRRVDEWRVIEPKLGSFSDIVVIDATAMEAVEPSRFDRLESRVLATIDGHRTIRQVIEESHLSSFDACRVLTQLIEARLVRRRAS